MSIEWKAATVPEQLEFIDKLRRAVVRFCYFHRGGQAELKRATHLGRTTIHKFCKGAQIRPASLVLLANALPGWDAPTAPAVTLYDHLAIRGNLAVMARKTGIHETRLKNAARGLPDGVNRDQKARLLTAYAGLITPDSFDAHVGMSGPRGAPEKVDTLERMTVPHAPKPQAKTEDPPIL